MPCGQGGLGAEFSPHKIAGLARPSDVPTEVSAPCQLRKVADIAAGQGLSLTSHSGVVP